jgi:transcriptional regulator of acetoin/glycerol metabolism
MTVLSPGDDKIDLEDIPIEILMSSGPGEDDFDKPQTGLIKLREEFEKRVMLNVLEATRWNQTEAAKILKMNRSFFIKKAKDFGIFLKTE